MVSLALVAAVAVFALAYLLFTFRERHRLLIAAVAAGGVVVVGLVPFGRLLPTGVSGQGSVVEWNTLALLLALFLFAALLEEVGLFRWLAEEIAARSHGRPRYLLFGLALAAFGLSAFINSITVLLVLATLTVKVARALALDPVPYLLAEISASNAGGAATFEGDPPNVILGTYFQLSFADFAEHAFLPALAAFVVVLLIFGRSVRPALPPSVAAIPVRVEVLRRGPAAAALGGFGGTLAVFAFQGALGIPVWAIGVGGAVVALGLAWGLGHGREIVARLDYATLLFFLFLFVLVGSLVTTGAITALAGGLQRAGGGNLLVTGTLLLWTLGLLSSVVNNVPLAAAAAPLIAILGGSPGLATRPLVWATALGTDIGGSGTPIGASANVVGLAAAKHEGVVVSWPRYLRIAFPTMLASLAAANLVWIFVH
ncbi:MAG: anion permease [Thermoplasmata archaeon]|nr:anion permease [Thermoplasmata archaeon]